MTQAKKQDIIAKVTSFLSKLLDEEEIPIASSAEQPVEMLTIKECTQAVSGLSEHTVRQLVAQHKIPYIRTGQGKRGKILISKTALLEYLGGAA